MSTLPSQRVGNETHTDRRPTHLGYILVVNAFGSASKTVPVCRTSVGLHHSSGRDVCDVGVVRDILEIVRSLVRFGGVRSQTRGFSGRWKGLPVRDIENSGGARALTHTNTLAERFVRQEVVPVLMCGIKHKQGPKALSSPSPLLCDCRCIETRFMHNVA